MVEVKETSTVATQPKTSEAPPPPSRPRGKLGLTDHRVNKFEKYLLVWGGKYKTVQEVPDLVNQDVLERARNKARIKINIMMCVATLLSCLAMVYAGKRAQKRGESVIKMNEDWHKKYNEEAKIAQAKADHASN
ncbi:UPF0389 protein CG9231-like [Homarus americanus]|uniref:UPF0389 protein CG9231-like n=1 Tax=Homarus americanus TaxID=6706 RepID=UPI001C47B780|nr:UPF0389 protein CG9231-like [Homarus americanus]